MPPKPIMRRYREPVVPEGELHPAIREFLLTGASPARDASEDVRDIEFEPDRAERLWKLHRRELVAEAKRRRFSPYALSLFEGAPLKGLPAWGSHTPNPLPVLAGRPVRPCPRCGSREMQALSCLASGGL